MSYELQLLLRDAAFCAAVFAVAFVALEWIARKVDAE